MKSFTRIPQHYKFDYKPRYYNPDQKPEEEERERISFRKGKTSFSKSPISGKFTTHRLINRPRSKDNSFGRVFMIAGMLTFVGLIYLEKISIWAGAIGVLLLLVIFLALVNKMNRP